MYVCVCENIYNISFLRILLLAGLGESDMVLVS